MTDSPSDNASITSAAEEGWKRARYFASALGPIPGIMTNVSKVLWKAHLDQEKSGSSEIPLICLDAIRPLEKSLKLKTPLIAAAPSLCGDKYKEPAPEDALTATLNAMGPGLFMTTLCLIYIYRRLNKVCRHPDWVFISKELLTNMEMGFTIAKSSGRLKPMDGMMLGALRFAALSCFMIKKPQDFTKYRKANRKKFDLEQERSMFGCEHSQVASYFFLDFGLRKDLLDIDQAIRKTGSDTSKLSQELQIWRSACFFLDDLRVGVCPPRDQTHAARLEVVVPQGTELLKTKANSLADTGSTFSWMAVKSSESEDAGAAPE